MGLLAVERYAGGKRPNPPGWGPSHKMLTIYNEETPASLVTFHADVCLNPNEDRLDHPLHAAAPRRHRARGGDVVDRLLPPRLRSAVGGQPGPGRRSCQ